MKDSKAKPIRSIEIDFRKENIDGISVSKEKKTNKEIENWVSCYIARILDINESEVDTKIPFDRFGLDSSSAIELIGDLEEWIGTEVDPTSIYDYPTIELLANYLSKNEGFDT